MTLRLSIVGLGKIAADQHVPAIARTPGVELVAVASPDGGLPGVPHFSSLDGLLSDGPAFDAVAICTPPQIRRALAEAALRAGKHVLLEKPPGATVAEIAPLIALAQGAGLTLFAAWHSRFAPAVGPARAFLANRAIGAVTVDWKEDVRVWHPGQAWIFEPGGLGVFDPGINALSIVTEILPRPLFLTSADLAFPENKAAPIAAVLRFADASGDRVTAEFDFRQTGPQSWDITVETDAGTLTLASGGAKLTHDGAVLVDEPEAEYAALYARFAELAAAGASDVDLAPFVHVADAFMLGRRRTVEPFEDQP